MIIAKVVGNVVSTIKDKKFDGHKLMIIQPLGIDGEPCGERQIAFDCVDSGPGDKVLVNTDGGAAQTFFNDKELIADYSICGVIDKVSLCDK